MVIGTNCNQVQDDYKALDLSVDYRETIVAYIDILGFSKLIRNCFVSEYSEDVKNKRLNTISEIVNFVRNIVLDEEICFKTSNDPFYLHVSFISDSIVISSDPDHLSPNILWHILKYTGSIGLNLLAIGVSCRGSIVVDKIFHRRESNFDAVVGPALVKAVELEKNVAVFPRILVDKSVIRIWEEFVAAELPEVQESYREVVKQDQDGEWFINIFHQYIENAVKLFFHHRECQHDYDPIKKAGDSIMKGCKESDRRVRGKYTWLRCQFRSQNPFPNPK
ncbi:MAG: hypothetical protein ACLP3B_06275 [Syntrophobacteraceae bacterium]